MDISISRVEASVESIRRPDPRRLPASAELQRLFIEEVWASCRLAGSTLSLRDVEALVERGVARGEHRLDAYVLTDDYAAAARIVAASAPPRVGAAFLTLEDVVTLHQTALRRSATARPGTWRTATLPALDSGLVPPAPWSIPREIGAFIETFGRGPQRPTPALRWVAESHQRFLRLRPFAVGNGRVARLMLNLLLRRLGLPPFTVPHTGRAGYRHALARADAGDLGPLTVVIGRSILSTARRLLAADQVGALVPLRQLAEPRELQALYKAAQRGRFPALRRGRELLVSASALRDYRSRTAGKREAVSAGSCV